MSLLSVTLTPSLTDLPGGSVIQQFADGLAAWGLLAALIALVVGAALWAIGSHTQNMHHSLTGRRAVTSALVAALLVGAAPTLINFFFSAGLKVH